MGNIRKYMDHFPNIDPTAYVDEAAVVIGDVTLEARVNLWPTVVLRGDQGSIHIGEETSIQDASVAHATGGLSVVRVGKRCTVGHKVLLHGCIVDDDCLIGMGAILMDNCRVGAWSIIGAGALVTANTQIPEGSLVLGSPAKVVRKVTASEKENWIQHGHLEYQKLMRNYQHE